MTVSVLSGAAMGMADGAGPPLRRIDPAPFSRQFRRDVAIVDGAIATPLRLDRVQGTADGCLYEATGARIDLSMRIGGRGGDHFVTAAPDRIDPRPFDDAALLPGNALYLGHMMAHYGHFLTETLSTFWYLLEKAPCDIDHYVFHAFAFGDRMPDFVRQSLSAFGIVPAQVRIIGDAPARFERIVVPERLLILNECADPGLKAVYRHIAERLLGPLPDNGSPTRIYLSRKKITRRRPARAVVNETVIETVFETAGFQVLYPESMPFTRQLAVFSRAGMIAGLSGSALHNCVFMPDNGIVLELGDRRYRGGLSPAQAVCAAIAGAAIYLIPFRGRYYRFARALMFDRRYLETRLRDLLPEMPGYRYGPGSLARVLRSYGDLATAYARQLGRRLRR